MTVLNQAKSIILDAVFPRHCYWCKEEGALLCERCFALWTPRSGEVQGRQGAIDAHFASFHYSDSLVRTLIRDWKYHFDETAWELIQRKLSVSYGVLRELGHAHRIDVIVPLPLHYRRACERGFDQAQKMAQVLSSALDLPIGHHLQRIRPTGRQAERSMLERKEYMHKNPFRACGYLEGARILLLDDVWTTGSTAQAAGQVLKDAGVEKVLCYTLAKG
jgi:ComF family protein